VRRATGSSWLGPTAAFFAGAALVSVLGGPLLVGLLAGGVAAVSWRPLRRDPPWTVTGRAAWRARAALLTEGARAWGLLWRHWRQARTAVPPAWEGPAVDPADARAAARFDAAFRVRCEVVGERFQVWHSTDTGRAYEVAPRDAPADALPGNEGWLSFEGGRPRVRPWAEPGAAGERLLN
jgi:hypothetical protein